MESHPPTRFPPLSAPSPQITERFFQPHHTPVAIPRHPQHSIRCGSIIRCRASRGEEFFRQVTPPCTTQRWVPQKKKLLRSALPPVTAHCYKIWSREEPLLRFNTLDNSYTAINFTWKSQITAPSSTIFLSVCLSVALSHTVYLFLSLSLFLWFFCAGSFEREDVCGERRVRDWGLQQFGWGAHAVGQHESRTEIQPGPSPVQAGPEIPRRAAQMPLTGCRRRDPQLWERPQLHG